MDVAGADHCGAAHVYRRRKVSSLATGSTPFAIGNGQHWLHVAILVVAVLCVTEMQKRFVLCVANMSKCREPSGFGFSLFWFVAVLACRCFGCCCFVCRGFGLLLFLIYCHFDQYLIQHT